MFKASSSIPFVASTLYAFLLSGCAPWTEAAQAAVTALLMSLPFKALSAFTLLAWERRQPAKDNPRIGDDRRSFHSQTDGDANHGKVQGLSLFSLR